MKASEVIKRLQYLMEISQDDPEVVCKIEEGIYEDACFEKSNMTYNSFQDRYYEFHVKAPKGETVHGVISIF